MIQELNELRAKQNELSATLERLEGKLDLLLRQSNNKIDKPPKKLLDVVDVAELCMVSQQSVYRWASIGKLPKCKVAGRLLFRMEDVKAFLSNKRES